MLREEIATISNQEYKEAANVSRRTALRDLDDLVARGVVRRLGETGRGTRYEIIAPETRQTRQKRATNAPEAPVGDSGA